MFPSRNQGWCTVYSRISGEFLSISGVFFPINLFHVPVNFNGWKAMILFIVFKTLLNLKCACWTIIWKMFGYKYVLKKNLLTMCLSRNNINIQYYRNFTFHVAWYFLNITQQTEPIEFLLDSLDIDNEKCECISSTQSRVANKGISRYKSSKNIFILKQKCILG